MEKSAQHAQSKLNQTTQNSIRPFGAEFRPHGITVVIGTLLVSVPKVEPLSYVDGLTLATRQVIPSQGVPIADFVWSQSHTIGLNTGCSDKASGRTQTQPLTRVWRVEDMTLLNGLPLRPARTAPDAPRAGWPCMGAAEGFRVSARAPRERSHGLLHILSLCGGRRLSPAHANLTLLEDLQCLSAAPPLLRPQLRPSNDWLETSWGKRGGCI